jgi:16S rRNA (guanine527-N7)-methyltransferase
MTSDERFDKFSKMLRERNEVVNLTSIVDVREIEVKHFEDSLSIVPIIEKYIGKGAKIIDIGTGAGFPGIPVKLMMSDIDLTLMDSVRKKVSFVNDVIRELKLDKAVAIHGRAEDYANKSDFREGYDVVTARAVAALPVLCEYCLPFLKVGGIFIAMKGGEAEDIGLADNALKILGGKIIDELRFELGEEKFKRRIIVVKKVKRTPSKYPRKAGIPAKKPL